MEETYNSGSGGGYDLASTTGPGILGGSDSLYPDSTSAFGKGQYTPAEDVAQKDPVVVELLCIRIVGTGVRHLMGKVDLA